MKNVAVTFFVPKSIYEWPIMAPKVVSFLQIGGKLCLNV